MKRGKGGRMARLINISNKTIQDYWRNDSWIHGDGKIIIKYCCAVQMVRNLKEHSNKK